LGETRRPDRLLEGEDPKSLVPKDARHWIAVYRYQRRLEYWFARQWELEGLQIDYENRIISYRERSIVLSKREFQLLVFLTTRSPVYTKPNQLLVQAWHDSRLPEESLRTYIGKVRAKLARLKVGAEIKNRPREGYALIFDNQKKPPAF